MKLSIPVWILTLALSIALSAQTPASPEALLKAAQQREQVDGDWRGALALYRSIADRFPTHVSSVRALMAIAATHERHGERQLALQAYEQALKHPHAKTVVAEAKIRIKALSGAEPGLERRRISLRPEGFGEHGRLSPDGQWMSFIHSAPKVGSGNLGIWHLATGKSQLLTGEPCCEWKNGYAETAAWSPDGRRLAYAWRNSRLTELRILERASGKVRVLLSPDEVESVAGAEGSRGAWIEPFAWSPDGDYILAGVSVFAGPGVSGNAKLIRVGVKDAATTVLRALGVRNLPGHGTYSSDGKFIAYDYKPSEEAAGRDVFVMTADGQNHVAVVADPSSDDMLIGWTPDRRHLLYAGDRLGRRDVWAMPVAGGRASGQPFLVTRDVGDLLNLGLAADGRFLTDVRLNQSDIFVTTLDPRTGLFASTPAPLMRAQSGAGRSQATWSPDGSRIAYFQAGPGRPYALVVQGANPGNLRSYSLPVRNAERPVWHPDGRSIAFNAVGDADAQAVFVLDLTTEKVTQVATGPQVAFSHDGRYLYYIAPQTVRRRNLGDGTEDVVARSGGVASALRLSPDGRHFASFRGQTRAIVILPADGVGEPRILAEGIDRAQNQLAWSPDGKFVLFAVDGTEVWRISIDGGSPEKIGAIVERTGVIKHLSVAPDGRLAMSLTGYDSELWLWNNLPALVGRK